MTDYVLYGLLLLAAVLGFFNIKSTLPSLNARMGAHRKLKDLKRKDVVLIVVATIALFALLFIFNFW